MEFFTDSPIFNSREELITFPFSDKYAVAYSPDKMAIKYGWKSHIWFNVLNKDIDKIYQETVENKINNIKIIYSLSYSNDVVSMEIVDKYNIILSKQNDKEPLNIRRVSVENKKWYYVPQVIKQLITEHPYLEPGTEFLFYYNKNVYKFTTTHGIDEGIRVFKVVNNGIESELIVV
jgi:hypothetical protein